MVTKTQNEFNLNSNKELTKNTVQKLPNKKKNLRITRKNKEAKGRCKDNRGKTSKNQEEIRRFGMPFKSLCG